MAFARARLIRALGGSSSKSHQSEVSMSTTALIVELVIVGIQVTIWVSMIVVLLSGYQWLNPDTVGKIATPLAVILLAVCYTIGIIFDAFTALLEDKLFERREISEADRGKRRALRQKLRLRDS